MTKDFFIIVKLNVCLINYAVSQILNVNSLKKKNNEDSHWKWFKLPHRGAGWTTMVGQSEPHMERAINDKNTLKVEFNQGRV